MPKKPTVQIAKYSTKCPHCGFKTIPGKDTVIVHQNKWLHEACYNDYREALDADIEVIKEEIYPTQELGPIETSPVFTYDITTQETIIKHTQTTACNMEEAIKKVTNGHINMEVIEVKKVY